MPTATKLLPLFTDLGSLEQAYYGDAYPDSFAKASGGYSTQTTGVYNPIFSAYAWANFNLEANIYALFVKYPYSWSGWRIYTEKAGDIPDAGTNNNTVRGGVVENGLVPPAISPPVAELFSKPKTIAYTINTSQVLENLNNISQDDAFGAIAQQKLYAADQFKENVNKMLAFDPSSETTAAEDSNQRKEIESLDRIVASKKKFEAALAINGSLPANAYNPWADTVQINRDSSTLFDSVIRGTNGDTELQTASTLSEGDITDQLAAMREASGKQPNVMLGGQDTYSTLQKLYSGAYRMNDPVLTTGYSSVTVNGVETFRGTDAGVSISRILGIPYIPSKDTPKGLVSGTDSNMYFLNTGYDQYNPTRPLLGYSVLMPPVLYEAGQSTPGFPLTLGSFSNFGVYETLAESICTNFKAQGELINIAPSNSS